MNLTKNAIANQRLAMVQIVQDLRPASERNREWALFLDGNRVGWLECFPMVCGMACGWVIYSEHNQDMEDDKIWRLEDTVTTRIPYKAVQETLLYLSLGAS